jgi:hypothetical protein
MKMKNSKGIQGFKTFPKEKIIHEISIISNYFKNIYKSLNCVV